MHCDEFRQRLGAYLSEELEGLERHTWRKHLAECATCSSWAVAEEPALLFATLPAEEHDPQRVAACVTEVRALIRQERLRSKLPPPVRPWLAVAAAVAMMFGASAWWQLRTPAAAPSPAPVVATAEVAPETPQPPQVEVTMEGEGVCVYHFATDDDTDTAVAFIVNPALES